MEQLSYGFFLASMTYHTPYDTFPFRIEPLLSPWIPRAAYKSQPGRLLKKMIRVAGVFCEFGIQKVSQKCLDFR